MFEKKTINANTILVSSGKGGGGKSTKSCILAQQLSKKGKKVALIDSDMHCSSIRTIFGIEKSASNFTYKYGVNVLALETDPTQHFAWRGPIATKVLRNMIDSQNLLNFDYVIIDMPPGTGDMHMSLASNYHIRGAVIVSTPQRIAFNNAIKAVNLYKIYSIEILAIVENMSDLVYSNENLESPLEKLAQTLQTSKTIKVQFNSLISKACDEGLPLDNLETDLTQLLDLI